MTTDSHSTSLPAGYPDYLDAIQADKLEQATAAQSAAYLHARMLASSHAYAEGYNTLMYAADNLATTDRTGPISCPYVPGTIAANDWEAGSAAAIADLELLDGTTDDAS